MFRKYYKEANDSIKPDEAFVASVIENAKKHKPPLHARYTKYAVGLAAAIVIVSGTVLSMPLWQKVTDDTDGVIIEETVTDNTAAESAETAVSEAPATPAPQARETATPEDKSVNSSAKAPSRGNPSHSADVESVKSVPQITEEPSAETVPEAQSHAVEADKATEAPAMPAPEPEAVTENIFEANAEMAADSEGELYFAKAAGASSAASMSEETATPAMPNFNTPSGYYTVYASGDYYEFENDNGDTVTVNLYWVGGEDSAAVYGNDGGAYTAELKRNGYNITIYGSDKDAVIETVNLLN